MLEIIKHRIFENQIRILKTYIDELNEAQRQAVLQKEGPMIIIAGAGSGKTRVLTYRIAHLMKSGIDPFNILSLTFTNKAAREMKSRIAKVVGQSEAKNLWMGTFHSVFARILRSESDKLGFPSNFTIYDTQDSVRLISSIIKEMNLEKEKYKPKQVLGRISQLKNSLITIRAYYQNPELIESDKMTGRPKIGSIYKEYVERCFKAGAMDFDDLLLRTNELLHKNEAVLAKYQDRFRYILVDEYQDTNKAQYEMISLFTKGKGNLFVVGDNDQSIYGWRGADIRNISEFEADFKGAKVIKLEQNYRSTKNILDVANAVIKHNLYRKDKNLWSANGKGEKIKYYSAFDEYNEADFIVSRVNSLIDDGYTTKEMAILYRTNAQSRVFEERFRAHDIPYRLVGSSGFYGRKEIKDILAYLRIIQNPLDEVSLIRVVNEPKRGVGNKTVEKLQVMAEEHNISLFEMIGKAYQDDLISGKARIGLKEFYESVNTYAIDKENYSVTDILNGIYVDSGYKKVLEVENSLESQGRMDNIGELLSAVAEYQIDNDEASLGGFLESISLMSDIDRMDDDEIG
ncbi:MAG: UvrD-helicase domain-containing protein, partial [Flavobacteriaceae bacterium]|nr:UvrD-helicase domain-containing protein [Flavobacteriaceae bacterium]